MRYMTLILCLLLTSCQTLVKPTPFHAIAKVEVTIHCMSANQIAEEIAKRGYPKTWSAFSEEKDIYVPGTIVNGAYVPDPLILGHEILHQMGRANPMFENPDKVKR